MSPTPRNSRLHKNTRINTNLPHTNMKHSRRNTRGTTPNIGILPSTPVRHVTPSTYRHTSSSSLKLNSKTSNRPNRPRPRWYRPPPPEAYLIIRAHRRPIDGWGEDWSKKGDGWTFDLSIMSRSEHDGLVIKLEVRDRELNIVPPDDHILSLRLTRMILQCRILTGIINARTSSIGTEQIIVFPLGDMLSAYGAVAEVRLFDLGSVMPRGRCSAIASLRIN